MAIQALLSVEGERSASQVASDTHLFGQRDVESSNERTEADSF